MTCLSLSLTLTDADLIHFQTKGAVLKRQLHPNSNLYIQFRTEFLTDFLNQELGGDSSLNNTSIYLKNRAEICRCASISNYNSSLGKYLENITSLVSFNLQKRKNSAALSLHRSWLHTKETTAVFRFYSYDPTSTIIELFSGGFHSKKRKFNLDLNCSLVYYNTSLNSLYGLRKNRERKLRILEQLLCHSNLELVIF